MKRSGTRKIRGGSKAPIKGLTVPPVPADAENVVSLEPIKDGDEMAAWIQDNGKYTWEFGKYYKKSTYDSLPVPKLDPTTRQIITKPITYRAIIAKAPAKYGYIKMNIGAMKRFPFGSYNEERWALDSKKITDFVTAINRKLAQGYMLHDSPVVHYIPRSSEIIIQGLEKIDLAKDVSKEPGYCAAYGINQVPQEQSDLRGGPYFKEISVDAGWRVYGKLFTMTNENGSLQFYQVVVKDK